MLRLEIGFEDFLDILADTEATEGLEVRQTTQEQDALGEGP